MNNLDTDNILLFTIYIHSCLDCPDHILVQIIEQTP